MTVTIESRDFYETMHQYRHMPIANQAAVSQAYKQVIRGVDDILKPMVEALETAIEFYDFWAKQTKSQDESENFMRLATEARDAIAKVKSGK
jgi:hypothetical protein